MTERDEKLLAENASNFILTLELFNEVIDYCHDCGRFFDVRSGCEKDIREDERQKMHEKEER